MKISMLVLAFTAITFFSCNNEPKEVAPATKDSTATVENKIMIPASSCYASTGSKDSIQLKLEVFEHVVTGNLLYKLYQKDSNKGNFEGKLSGDTLLADYTFMSEGVSSVRQVIFLIKDTVAIEGYGNMEQKNGKTVFTDLSTISFDKSIPLHKKACDQ